MQQGLDISQNHTVVGVDEAGRGPLAGPVVASAVFLAADHGIEGLRDSKKISPKKRELLFDTLINSDKAKIGVAIVDAPKIDEINILQATFLAMRLAVEDLGLCPDLVQVDGNLVPPMEFPVEAIVKGDEKIEAISAASIVAKVTRDQMMLEYDEVYPGYGFKSHKGYGTRAHMEAIDALGPTKLHRMSFAPLNQLLYN